MNIARCGSADIRGVSRDRVACRTGRERRVGRSGRSAGSAVQRVAGVFAEATRVRSGEPAEVREPHRRATVATVVSRGDAARSSSRTRSSRMPRSIAFGATPICRWKACCSPRTLRPTCSATSVVVIGVWATACMYSTAARTRPEAPTGTGTWRVRTWCGNVLSRARAVRRATSARASTDIGAAPRTTGAHSWTCRFQARAASTPGATAWSSTTVPGSAPWTSAATRSTTARSTCTRFCRTSIRSKRNGRSEGNTTGRPGTRATSSRPTSTTPPPSLTHVTTNSSGDATSPTIRASYRVERKDIVASPTVRKRYPNGRSDRSGRKPEASYASSNIVRAASRSIPVISTTFRGSGGTHITGMLTRLGPSL